MKVGKKVASSKAIRTTEQTIDNLLGNLSACYDARMWAKGQTWQEIFNTCHRGDWLLWLFRKVNPDDVRLLTLAKGHCANTVRHLMKDNRSMRAVDAAIAYGENSSSIREVELKTAAADAAAAAASDVADVAGGAVAAADAAVAAVAAAVADAAAAAAVAADAAAAAAYAAGAAADAAAAAAYAADAADAADAAAAARIKNRQLTADICRKYLPIKIWNITKGKCNE